MKIIKINHAGIFFDNGNSLTIVHQQIGVECVYAFFMEAFISDEMCEWIADITFYDFMDFVYDKFGNQVSNTWEKYFKFNDQVITIEDIFEKYIHDDYDENLSFEYDTYGFYFIDTTHRIFIPCYSLNNGFDCIDAVKTGEILYNGQIVGKFGASEIMDKDYWE